MMVWTLNKLLMALLITVTRLCVLFLPDLALLSNASTKNYKNEN
ncbi:hypothetical protein N824_00365 [Pedobacter sp. V48]|nr:hypothetical protein N824_00365 [Pedobacter sp. V48]